MAFIIIALNAESTLEKLFECLRKQSYPHELIEVILVDSHSIDSTKEIMIRFKSENPVNGCFKRVVVLDNPKKTLPCGWNVALKAVQSDTVLRVDAHTVLPDQFIELNVKNFSNGENICGGKVISIPAESNHWSNVVNQAENSMFGGSIASFRHADTAKYVSTAAFAMYRKSVFDAVGQYNEQLTRTEDNEMHYRMKKAGFQFYYDPMIKSYRYTRATLGALLKQKYLNGYWIGRTLKVEPRCFSLYHFVPLAFVLAIIFSTVIALVGIVWPAAVLWCAYGIVNLLMSIASVVECKERSLYLFFLPVMFLLLHIVYGAGTIMGVLGIKL